MSSPDVLVSSRSLEEYTAFFNLTDDDLRRRVLDCPAGASDFVARVNAGLGDAVGVDRLYADPEALTAAIAEGPARVAAIVDANPSNFDWSWYGDPDTRVQTWSAAAERFLLDRTTHPEHYVAAALPDLPFADTSFGLALSSHLLFSWSELFDEDWHLAAILELTRVAEEVRVYPLVEKDAGEPVPFLDSLRDRLAADGHSSELEPVAYRFQPKATHLLKVR